MKVAIVTMFTSQSADTTEWPCLKVAIPKLCSSYAHSHLSEVSSVFSIGHNLDKLRRIVIRNNSSCSTQGVGAVPH